METVKRQIKNTSKWILTNVDEGDLCNGNTKGTDASVSTTDKVYMHQLSTKVKLAAAYNFYKYRTLNIKHLAKSTFKRPLGVK